jgi:multidrug transporter EmrE-like cation transporter
MSIPQIVILSLVEIIGDFGLKQYANKGGITNLGIGIVGYIGVVSMLVVALQGSSILMVNGAWDGTSTLIEGIAAYLFLGERLDSEIQYVGLAFIVIGLYLLKIPWSKKNKFQLPSL